MIKNMEDVLERIRLERQRQDRKWGEQNHDDFTWNTILSEEVGEAAKAALHKRFGGSDSANLITELVKVAAVAVSWIECICRNRPICPECFEKGLEAPHPDDGSGANFRCAFCDSYTDAPFEPLQCRVCDEVNMSVEWVEPNDPEATIPVCRRCRIGIDRQFANSAEKQAA